MADKKLSLLFYQVLQFSFKKPPILFHIFHAIFFSIFFSGQLLSNDFQIVLAHLSSVIKKVAKVAKKKNERRIIFNFIHPSQPRPSCNSLLNSACMHKSCHQFLNLFQTTWCHAGCCRKLVY